jgi:hypothetical protein
MTDALRLDKNGQCPECKRTTYGRVIYETRAEVHSPCGVLHSRPRWLAIS